MLSVPAADAHAVGIGTGSTAFEPGLQPEKEVSPLGAAVRHELDRLAPVGMREEYYGFPLGLGGLEVDREVGADPLIGSLHAVPPDLLVRGELDDLHDGAWLRTAEEEPELPAQVWVAVDVPCPPSREPLLRRQRLVDARCWCSDPHTMPDARHLVLL